jgi:hypothetical protein
MTVTDVLALWGATLSTFVVGREYWTSRDKLTVEVFSGSRGDSDRAWIVVHIRNFGKRPITVGAIALAWPGRKASIREKLLVSFFYAVPWRLIGWFQGSLPALDDPHDLPKTIDQYQSHDIWIPLDAILKPPRDNLERFAFRVQDRLGRNHDSPIYAMQRKNDSMTYERVPDQLTVGPDKKKWW